MAFSLSSLADPSLWFGAGGTGIVGFIGGHFRSSNRKIATLEKEVEACRERDAHVVVLTACFRCLWGEQMRRDPHNQVLRMCGDLIATKIPITPEERSLDGLAGILAELDKLPGVRKK